MIFFGHLGLTTAAVKACEIPLRKRAGEKQKLDYRFVLIGSILPDLIDKPLGMFVLHNVFHNSRLFAHTLLFTVLLLIAGGIVLKKKGGSQVLLLGAGCLMHLILDSMWQFPRILLWPFIGGKVDPAAHGGWLNALVASRAFPARPGDNWIADDWRHLLSSPVTLGAEIVGFAILAFFFVRSMREHRLKDFFRRGIL